ncbi:hypothetical protein Mapa_003353 [Marchantia paleacea]|nr:hypothetical protein Mapa_003353 [Marchantia paleacea]
MEEEHSSWCKLFPWASQLLICHTGSIPRPPQDFLMSDLLSVPQSYNEDCGESEFNLSTRYAAFDAAKQQMPRQRSKRRGKYEPLRTRVLSLPGFDIKFQTTNFTEIKNEIAVIPRASNDLYVLYLPCDGLSSRQSRLPSKLSFTTASCPCPGGPGIGNDTLQRKLVRIVD